ncbi:hypothetical protein AMECASPLE_025200, partial [Ameca splendens]
LGHRSARLRRDRFSQRDVSALSLRSWSRKEEQWKRSACWREGALIQTVASWEVCYPPRIILVLFY